MFGIENSGKCDRIGLNHICVSVERRSRKGAGRTKGT